jgi:hypothetical protein
MEFKFDWRAKLGVVLFMVILITGVYLIMNFDHIFDNVVKIKYPDGCTEVFVNGNLNTTECTAGRAMMNQSMQEEYPKLNFNGNISIG